MSEQVADTQLTDKVESHDQQRRWLPRAAVGVVGALALGWGVPAMFRATAPGCDTVLNYEDNPTTHAIHLPDGRVLYGNVFQTADGVRVMIGGYSEEFDQAQIAQHPTDEYPVGDNVTLRVHITAADRVETSCIEA